MANSETYTALLKVQKWRDTPFVGVADSQVLCNDMHLVAHVLKEQTAEIERLKGSDERRQVCNKCGEDKPVAFFEFRVDTNRHRPTCRVCREKSHKRTRERMARPVPMAPPPERWPPSLCMASVPVAGDRRLLVASL